MCSSKISCPPESILDDGQDMILCLEFTRTFGLFSALSGEIIGGKLKAYQIEVYCGDTTGNRKYVFNGHQGTPTHLAHLFDDVTASVDLDGTVMTWKASTGNVVSDFRTIRYKVARIAQNGDNKLCVGTACGNIDVVSHDGGKDLKYVWRLENWHSSYVRRVAVLGSLFVTLPWVLPDAESADDYAFVGIGANLEPGTILAAYRRGFFRWSTPINWSGGLQIRAAFCPSINCTFHARLNARCASFTSPSIPISTTSSEPALISPATARGSIKTSSSHIPVSSKSVGLTRSRSATNQVSSSAGCTASPSGAYLQVSPCFTERPMPRRRPSSTWVNTYDEMARPCLMCNGERNISRRSG